MSDLLDIRSFSRREFLKMSGAGLAALLSLSAPSLAYASSSVSQTSLGSLGRITKSGTKMYTSPSLEATLVEKLNQDLVLPITNTMVVDTEPFYNKIWYELDGKGFVHSGRVQPVETRLNSLIQTLPTITALAEVTVPFTDATWNPQLGSQVAYRLYYSTTHWVIGTASDNRGNLWYEILEDFYRFHYFARADHLRIIPPEETTTLSADVPASEKKLIVNLDDQLVVAYEGDSQVQLFRCAAGAKYGSHYLTPTGSFTTDYKRPSRHMIDGNNHQMNTYDLPGVPWVTFIEENGVSFHGTYWHNDFGTPRSHGCINLPSPAAKWVYRWTLPAVPYEEQRGYKKGAGTRVEIL